MICQLRGKEKRLHFARLRKQSLDRDQLDSLEQEVHSLKEDIAGRSEELNAHFSCYQDLQLRNNKKVRAAAKGAAPFTLGAKREDLR